MILYPLVENSVFHGIIPSNTASLLKIVITGKDNWIKVTVEDDGVGCTAEERERIRQRLEEERTGGHIGMFNVNGRLKLIYKEVHPLKMERRLSKNRETKACLEIHSDIPIFKHTPEPV